jgi:hypothetical protein
MAPLPRKKARDQIAATIEAKYGGTVRASDGTIRPHVNWEDCQFIADLILGEIGPTAGLRQVQSKAKNDNAPRP